jgi:PAS domain S-box-containing protein
MAFVHKNDRAPRDPTRDLLGRERAARERAEHSEARFRLLAEELPQFVFVAAPDGTLEYVNDQVARYMGMDLPSLKEGGWIDAIHPEDRGAVMDRWKEILSNGKPLDIEYRLRNGAGEYRWFLGRAVAHRDRSGAIAQIFGTSTDIDDQKRHQRELASASEFREQLLGIVAHDLRNPLASIVYAAAALLKRGTLNEADGRTVARVAASADRMAHIVDQTLDFTRFRLGGGIPISVAEADLASICRQAVEEMEVAHPGVEFELSIDGDARGTWDARRLSQLVSNLLGNAVQHGVSGRPVQVRLRGDAGAVELVVRNDGPPIPAALLPVIFEAFRHGARRQQSSGSLGLGLFIVRQIALAHGGDVTAHSSPSEATSFVVRLPRGARAM